VATNVVTSNSQIALDKQVSLQHVEEQAHAGGDRYKIIDALWREKQMRGRDRPGRLNYL
jgi:hypothetical protein